MKAFKIEILVINHDGNEIDDITAAIENLRYYHPSVMSVKEADIGEWSDDHPLNKRETSQAVFKRIFGDSEDKLDKKTLFANIDSRIRLLRMYERNIYKRDANADEIHAYELKIIKEKVETLERLREMVLGSDEEIKDTTAAIDKIHERVKESGAVR